MTKWLLFLALALATVGQAKAQSIQVSNLDSIVYGLPSETLTAHATITNTSSTAIDVFVNGTHTTGAPANTNYYFCWFVCYSAIPVTDDYSLPPSHTITLQPGQDTTGLFAAYYEPEGEAAVAHFEYCFSDNNNPSDETCVSITFDTQNVGIEDVFESDRTGISEAYPNPASTNVHVNYALAQGWNQAQITLYSMLGSPLKTIDLHQQQGTAQLDVSSLPAGMYFYTLTVGNNTIGTKKMLVTK